MSKGVRDRIKRSRSVILAGFLYADVLDEAKRRLQSPVEKNRHLPEGIEPVEDHSSATLGDVFRFIAMDIEEAGEAMSAADETLARCEVALHRERRKRNLLAKKLYGDLVETRDFFMGLLGYREGCDYLDLRGPTPRDPVVLLSWTRTALAALTDPGKAPTCRYADNGRLKTSDLARRLEDGNDALRAAVSRVVDAGCDEIAAREARHDAIAAFDQTHTPGARVLEATLDQFGLPSLAATVRPGVKRRGRPPKERPLDTYPDLVARILGHRPRVYDRPSETATSAFARGHSKAAADHQGPKLRQEKIENAAHKQPGEVQKSGNGSHERLMADQKSAVASHQLESGEGQIETGIRKRGKDEANLTVARLTPPNRGRRPRRRIVHGLDPRLQGRTRRATTADRPGDLRSVRQSISRWWRRLSLGLG